jgi:TRAP-type C4-dicarboxylate transport system substrate-binding protein
MRKLVDRPDSEPAELSADAGILACRALATAVNKAAFDALDKPTQEAILKAAVVAEERGWKLAEEKAKWYLEQLQAYKMQVLPPALKSGLEKIGEQLTADWSKKAGADGEAVVAAYKK